MLASWLYTDLVASLQSVVSSRLVARSLLPQSGEGGGTNFFFLASFPLTCVAVHMHLPTNPKQPVSLNAPMPLYGRETSLGTQLQLQARHNTTAQTSV